MNPLPRPTPPALTKARHSVQMTSGQYLRWRARRRLAAPIAVPTKEEADAAIAHIQGIPYWRDVVEAVDTVAPATVDAAPTDEVDAGYLVAIRLEPRTVGTAAGQVPMEVAIRLYKAGLIRKVEK